MAPSITRYQEHTVAAPFHVVFALFPRITQLDFTGPYEVLTRLPGARCVLASVAGGDLEVDSGHALLRAAPARRHRRMRSALRTRRLRHGGGRRGPGLSRRLRRLGAKARYITSVCTGSLLLAAAGLLRGKRAACHWAWRDKLADFGVTQDPARVVRDGLIFTGGGVTAGIDMALEVMAEIGGRDLAETVQLAIEYAPAPPFESGRPELAREPVLRAARARLDSMRAERDAAIGRAAAALGAA